MKDFIFKGIDMKSKGVISFLYETFWCYFLKKENEDNDE
ncbi:hypothetical protein BMWSH_2829 [Priestia megaterium WSH-002]|uniref:Uncharacterized protein n=1 Tax=Priestia megaterium (strain WSH-002) TaxID=1006007 RepID=A0A8D4BKK8_PRIMW|nr:hypothetical protein BMWSH_2829 [Priestia megaterium WSH-002]